MYALIKYLHTCTMRSYRYVAPSMAYLLFLIFLYTVVPNPVMESYAFTSALLFAVAAWMGYLFIDVESPNQEMVTVLHAGGIIRLYRAKLIYNWLFTVPFALFAVIYPALLHKFDRNPTGEELLVSLVFHIALAWMGIALSCWFTRKLFQSRLLSFLLLGCVIAVSFAAKSVAEELPDGLDRLVLLLPPLHRAISVLSNDGNKWTALIAVVLYGAVSSVLFLIVMRKRKLHFQKG
ncbi:hypothetical protein [Paenibacillus guangzhouensis]|uniref:hypothetical protein n=1 Tax=Paenibacillus guangzhouensis TaxID=1473112 RepID=UPI0012676213|nr:hypothetical protein [Paenibacillus guangzhouensis]